MAFDYTDLASTADALIAEFGALAQLKDEAGNNQGKLHMVFLENKHTSAKDPMEKGFVMSVEQVTLQALIAAKTKTPPAKGWTLTVDKTTYVVTQVDVVRPGPVTVMYKVEVTT